MNDIDKLDGMIKIKKCGYEIIGGCKELRKYKQTLEEIREAINQNCWDYTDITVLSVKDNILTKINEVLNENSQDN